MSLYFDLTVCRQNTKILADEMITKISFLLSTNIAEKTTKIHTAATLDSPPLPADIREYTLLEFSSVITN